MTAALTDRPASSWKSRARFAEERRAALVAERERIKTRLGKLQGTIRKIMTQLERRTITDPDEVTAALDKLRRLGSIEARLVDDINRLTGKIGR